MDDVPLPRIAITLGDPTGVGPEVIVAALQHKEIYRICHPVVIGRPEIVEQACRLLHLDSRVVEVTDDAFEKLAASGDPSRPNNIHCFSCGSPEAVSASHGRVDARGGQAAYDALYEATKWALEGRVEAIVTAPLHKAALHAAGHCWPGHTELLAHFCGIEKFAMMLYLPPVYRHQETDAPTPSRRGGPVGLGVVHVTLHMSMRDVFRYMTTDAILDKIALAHDTFARLRHAAGLSPSPAIAVAAFNPHAGEEGLFGDEEETIIRPAVELAKARGWNVHGPLPVDTLMPRAADGAYDVVVAMYHDQGHIALKLLDMYDAVNITLGLPILRTSVAHGTAHDQAWQGTAHHTGMIQAIRTAAWLAMNKSVTLP